MFRQRMGDGRVRRFEGTCWQVDTVCLWLGANVMMEFTFDEVSRSRIRAAKEHLSRARATMPYTSEIL
jgi:hypothetical protein